ncbi:MAG TPA: PadR family transcriptional regulator [Thermoplasmata archaeon]|nr:PadR family transcriptional regulator [Thermoplasmata archaeon]
MPREAGPRPGRILGFYAIAVMDREGPIYGYQLAERIAQRTDGAWRPGPGAIYPALQALTERGLARASRRERRRLYTITPAGRRWLARVRRHWMVGGGTGPDLSRLWAEVAGAADPGQHLARRLHRQLESLASMLEGDPAARAGTGLLIDQVVAELDAARARLGALPTARPAAARRRGRSR